ncbi:hypothetical protein PENTCL1PPCAC_10508, partial [Pristionchus entomophagus]
ACYISLSSSIRRDVHNVVPGTTLVSCQTLCDADASCQATLLNSAGTHCILLGAEASAAAGNACPAPFTSYVKTNSGAHQIVKY